MVIELSFACGTYDRVAPLVQGQVGVEGVELHFLPIDPVETFWRHSLSSEFDVCEGSLSGHILRTSRGDDRYLALPVFTSRAFRHRGIVVRADSGIEHGANLKGATIGLPEYHITASLTMKGLLADEFGVSARDVNWVQAGHFQPGRQERETLALPPDINLRVEKEKTLDTMLASGELQGLLSLYYLRNADMEDSRVRPLYAEPRKAEEDYYERTGIFPIMHVVLVRRELCDKHPWLPRSLVKGFEAAKRMCLSRFAGVGGHSPVSFPFFYDYIDETVARFGQDWWPYGVQRNREALSAATRWSFDQGLAERLLEPEELFPKSTLDESLYEEELRR